MMTFRERFFATLLFGGPDRVLLQPGGPRESTRRAWATQGLPLDADYLAVLYDTIGLPRDTGGYGGVPVSFAMLPTFEERVLTHADGHYVVQDWMGAIVEISDAFDYTYLRVPRDFVTRKWHKFPVETRADWEAMRARYDVDTPGRFGDDFHASCAALRGTDTVLSVQVNGPFWQLREWCGFEGLCALFLDDPDFVREMVAVWTEFVGVLLTRISAELPIDRLGISEDMAYKAHAMISPAMTRDFLLPTYTRWVEIVKGGGGQVIDLDSDGCVDELIPVWIDAGINVCSPMEVAAHTDLPALRQRFGRQMGYVGGVDKRAIATGGAVLDAELARLAPVIADGGYLPGCDHGIPPDISWPNYVDYARKLARLCGW